MQPQPGHSKEGEYDKPHTRIDDLFGQRCTDRASSGLVSARAAVRHGHAALNYLALVVASNCLSSRTHAGDAHDFFAECFINFPRSMRGRRVNATRELQHYTSARKFFVLGALVPAMLLAT